MQRRTKVFGLLRPCMCVTFHCPLCTVLISPVPAWSLMKNMYFLTLPLTLARRCMLGSVPDVCHTVSPFAAVVAASYSLAVQISTAQAYDEDVAATGTSSINIVLCNSRCWLDSSHWHMYGCVIAGAQYHHWSHQSVTDGGSSSGYPPSLFQR